MLVLGKDILSVESINETIKGRNNKTGESFGMVIGSDKQGNNGYELKVKKNVQLKNKYIMDLFLIKIPT